MRLTLTKRGEYGVRILLHLATKPPQTRMTAQELATECGIPLGNVPTIVNVMSRGGLLLSSPGRNGGCSLARSADRISTLEVIECLEGSFDISHCLLDSRRCHDQDPECAMHVAWKAGRDAAIGALANTSLAAVADREVELQGILVSPEPAICPPDDVEVEVAVGAARTGEVKGARANGNRTKGDVGSSKAKVKAAKSAKKSAKSSSKGKKAGTGSGAAGGANRKRAGSASKARR